MLDVAKIGVFLSSPLDILCVGAFRQGPAFHLEWRFGNLCKQATQDLDTLPRCIPGRGGLYFLDVCAECCCLAEREGEGKRRQCMPGLRASRKGFLTSKLAMALPPRLTGVA